MFRKIVLLCTAVCLTQGAGRAMGQIVPNSVGGPGFYEAWVDPCNGDDLKAAQGVTPLAPPCLSRPFRTIEAAQSVISTLQNSGPYLPGLVHCDPGVYSPITNGELLPVTMRPDIHLQGTGARQCIIRGYHTMPDPHTILFPEGHCVCGVAYANQKEVLVDMSFLGNSYETMIDGFTFQGGDVQVLCSAEADVRGRVSNCVFDMLDKDDTILSFTEDGGTVPTPIGGPSFGLLVVHRFDPSVPQLYRPARLQVLNNSFIMGWQYTDDLRITCIPDAVAICDFNDPLCGHSFPDPNPNLRGIGPLNIQNNLIRTLPGQAGTAMLGIDSMATQAAAGAPTGPSNAFDPVLASTMNSTGTFCVAFARGVYGATGLRPTPRVNINPTTGGRDPAFVGEMLGMLLGKPMTFGRDWRILPGSPLIDTGTMPTPLAVGGAIKAGNGTTYVEPAAVELSSFDLDGEGWGNLRVQTGMPLASPIPRPRCDIGFDEFSLMIDAGGYANDSISHRLGSKAFCGPIAPGVLNRDLIFPAGASPTAGTFLLAESRVNIPMAFATCASGLPGYFSAYSTMWGTAVPPVPVPGFPAHLNLNWMIPGLTVLGPSGTTTNVTYLPPNSVTPITFSIGSAPLAAPLIFQYLTEQSLYTPTGSPVTFISNGQSSTH